jgi:hypothetical protein
MTVAEARLVRAQPRLGAAGLALVVPIAALLALGAGGAEGSVLVLGPIVAYGLPLVAMVAFWWDGWPGTRLRPSWSGWADTALVAAGAVVLTGVGQAVAGGFDLRGMLDTSPGPGHVPTYPVALPLAGAAFAAMLEITLVGEGWPLRRLPPIPAGVVAVAAAWAVGLVVYGTLAEVEPPPGSGASVRTGPVPAEALGAVLVLVGAAQVLVYVVWRGWPFAAIVPRARRLAGAHASVVGAGVAAFLVAHGLLGVGAGRVTAVGGCFVAAGLLLGMQFDGWQPHARAPGADLAGDGQPGADPPAALAATLALTAALAVALHALAAGLDLGRVTTDAWVTHASLSALGASTILHVAIGRRWPFADQDSSR